MGLNKETQIISKSLKVLLMLHSAIKLPNPNPIPVIARNVHGSWSAHAHPPRAKLSCGYDTQRSARRLLRIRIALYRL